MFVSCVYFWSWNLKDKRIKYICMSKHSPFLLVSKSLKTEIYYGELDHAIMEAE